jgi:hypothetical protein
VADVGLSIAGLPMTIATSASDVSDLMADRYKGFLSSSSADWRVDVEIDARMPSGAPTDVRVFRNGGGDQFSVQRSDFDAIVDIRARVARAMLADANEYSLDTFFRILYSLALVDAGGLIVHAASLARAGHAYIFCGPSGSGKTTIAQLSPEATLLSDELSIVRMTTAGPRAFGTPFWGELARAGEDQAAPVTGIYFLRHGARHAVQAVTSKATLQRLLPNVVFFARDARLTASVLDIAATLADAVPCFDLVFRRDAGFWEVIVGD